MPKVLSRTPGVYFFKCPGCKDHHSVTTRVPQENGAIWGFNGDVDKPTFTPSLLMTSGHYCAFSGVDESECYFCNEYPDNKMCYICHSFVTDGKIQFLGDCTHELAGQTVELRDYRNFAEDLLNP